MKRYLILLLLFILPCFSSCEKHDTYGTLIVTIITDNENEFLLRIYPHHNETQHYYPVFSKEYSVRRVTEEIRLSPGNYIIDIFGGPKQGVNIIGGEEVALEFRI